MYLLEKQFIFQLLHFTHNILVYLMKRLYIKTVMTQPFFLQVLTLVLFKERNSNNFDADDIRLV